jgi:hypothetical protein
MRKKILNLAVFVGLFIYNSVFATEITYPTIGSVGMPANPTFANYFLYFFTAGLLVGTISAIIVIISVSVKYFISRGDLAKTESAKNEIIRAFIGLAILFGSILIVNTINSGINKNTIDNINTEQYSGGVMLQFQTDPEAHLGGDLREVTKQITGLRWLSKVDDLPRIYIYPSKDFVGDATEVKNGESPVINVGQSISFDWNIPGVYLYNDKDFKLKGRKSAFPVLISQPALSTEGFDKQTASIKIVQPKQKTANEVLISYGAVLFSGSNYTGKCSWVFNDLADIAKIGTQGENSVRVGTTDDFIGIGDPTIDSNKDFVGVSSIYLLRSPSNKSVSAVTLYNGTDCKSRDAVWDGAAFKDNICTVTDIKKELKFSEACKDMPQDGDTILSANVNEGTVLLLKDKDGNCQLLRNQGADTCIHTIPYGSVYDINDRANKVPRYFTLLPGE